MVEIYGSTETGAMATRRPTRGLDWETYSSITLQKNHDQTSAYADHFDTPQTLNDVVELLSPTQFRLLGRSSDMINIVGKRNSLAYLNQLVLSLPGVEDVVFCLHESGSPEETPRLLAFVVAPSLTGADILAHLRRHVDAVFLPRPLILLDRLARDINGKLAASTLAELRATHFVAKT